MSDTIISRFKSLVPETVSCSMRLVNSSQQTLSLRRDVFEPIANHHTNGAFINVNNGSGCGYAATSDTTREGLQDAINRAIYWARQASSLQLFADTSTHCPVGTVSYKTETDSPWTQIGIDQKIDLMQSINKHLHIHDAIVDWWVVLDCNLSETIFITTDTEIRQSFSTLTPYLGSVANRRAESQKRTFGLESGKQAGFESLDPERLSRHAHRISEQSLQLLDAKHCPSQNTDLLLMPDQMILQIHESIGHPLELDRILGDERNYAGSSFVTLDMFGNHQYGSDLLNITFDPSNCAQIASYHYDDEGVPAYREQLIRNGKLLRPIGGSTSQGRARVEGVAASRASGWNRAPIDRMANINLEPGETTLQQMVNSVENGILMETNRSWSIDDSRNKFQFGCELGQIIRNGDLGPVVKNPNYRGISSHFWHSLKSVGDQSSFSILSVPGCGKGEPNQAIQVGHASPPCLFGNIDVFGGQE